MKETKLVKLLKGVTVEDLRQIQKMLKSPFFTTNKNLITLYNLLRSCHPDFDSSKLEKLKVFKKVFPKHEYSDIKLRNLNSDLVQIIEDYFLMKSLKENDFERRLNLLKAYKKRNISGLFEKSLIKLEKEIQAKPYRDAIYYHQMMELKKLSLGFVESNQLKSSLEDLNEWGRCLDRFYLLAKSHQRISTKSIKKIIKTEEVNNHVYTDEENTLLRLYNKIEDLEERVDPQFFLDIKNDFEANIHLIRKNYQLDFHSLLVNFVIQQMPIDDEKYNRVVLELYKLGIKEDFYLKNDFIASNTFFNIVVSASKAKDFEWGLSFINNYSKFLVKDYRSEVKKISLSIFKYHKGEYSDAIDLIINHRFKKDQFKILARVHFIRCYYEMYLNDSTYFDLLISQIESNERFFYRNSDIPEEKISYHFHFLSFVKS